VQRLVLSSTCAVYGDEPTLPKVETMPPVPKSPYAISKLAAEHYCQLFNEAMQQETVILRYFNVFGPRQDPSSAYSGVISIFVDRLRQGAAPFIFGDGEQTRDFVFVKDVVQANLLAAQSIDAPGSVFNIATGHEVTINHLFYTLRDIFGAKLEPIYKPARSGDIRYSYGDATRAQEVLDWASQVELEAGLAALVDSMN
jgi:UDP-glucose 4-epimerase